VVTDHGTSGVTTKLTDRDGGKRLFDMLREGDMLVVRWVNRLGRNYQNVTDTIREFIRRGVTIKTVINGMVSDKPGAIHRAPQGGPPGEVQGAQADLRQGQLRGREGNAGRWSGSLGYCEGHRCQPERGHQDCPRPRQGRCAALVKWGM
jgi:hypothetical protein